MNKKRSVSIGISALLFFLNTVFVHATTFDLVNKKLRWMFFTLPATSAFEIWIKFVFFVIVFAALYNGGLAAMKSRESPQMKRAIAVITLILALTTAIFVQIDILLYIFKLYYVILVILFALLPPLVGYIVCQKVLQGEGRWLRFIRAIIYILITIFIMGLVGHIEANASPETELYMQVLEPMVWGAMIALIAGIWNLIMAVGGDSVVNNIPGWLGGRGGQPTPPTGPAGPVTPGGPPQGPAGGPHGPPPPGGPLHGPAVPPNPQVITQLRQTMMQFANAVINPNNPQNIAAVANNITHNFLRQLQQIGHINPNQPITQQTIQQLRQLNPQNLQQLRAAAQQTAQTITQFQQSQQRGSLLSARTLMGQIFQTGHQTQQYNNVEEPIRHDYEQAVAAFLRAEAQLANILALALSI